MAADKKVVFKVTVEADGANATVRDLKGRIVNTQVSVAALRKEFGNFSVSAKKSTELVGKSVDQLKGRVNNAKSSMSGLTKGLDGVSKSSGAAAATTLELGRVISDAPYGIRGMANNVSQVASQMAFMSRATDEVTGKVVGFQGAIKGVWQSMMGPLGILLAIQAVIAAVDFFAGGMKKAEKSVNDLNESMGAAASNLRILKDSLEQGVVTQEEANKAVNKANEEYEGLNISLDENNELTDDSVIAIDAKIKSLEKLAKALALQKLIEEKYTKLLPLEIKQTELDTKVKLANARAVDALSQSYRENGTATAEASAKRARSAVESGQKAIDKLKKEIADLLDVAGGEDLIDELFKSKKDKKGGKDEKRAKVESVGNILTGEEIEEARVKQAEQVDDLFQSKFMLEQENAQYMIDFQKSVGEQIANDAKVQGAKNYKTAEQQAEDDAQLAWWLATTKAKTLDYVASSMDSFSVLAGEQTALGKGFAIATATIDTYAGANLALKDPTIPNTFARIAAVTSVIATGLANVKSILSVKVPTKGGGSSSGGSVDTGRTFDFNLAGSTGQNQLAQTIGGQVQQPIKAYVVSSDITNQQQFDNQVQGEVKIG